MNDKQSKASLSKCVVLIALSVLSIDASAAFNYWNAVTGTWDEATKWSLNTVPTSSDFAIIDNGGAAVVGSSTIADPSGVFIGNNSNLSILAGGALYADSIAVSTTSLPFVNNGSGTLIVNGQAPNSSSLFVGSFITNFGSVPNAFQATVNIENNALVNVYNNDFEVNRNSTGGTTTVNLTTGGTLEVLQIATNSPARPATFIFDGGTLAPIVSNPDFISGFTPIQTFTINGGGLTIDTNKLGTPVDIGIPSTFPGFTGSGALTKTGAGTLTMEANNTYTGDTNINGGFFQLGNNGTTGGVAGNIVDNAGLIFNRSDAFTYAGNISGTGTSEKLGAGTTTLTGTNTYTGGTTISAGTLQIGSGGTSGSIVGNIVDNAALIFNRSDTVTYDDIISGTGTLTKLGSNTLILNGTNTFTGDTTITAGNVLLGDAMHSGAAVGGNVIVDPGAQLSGFGTVGGNLNNNGGIVSPGNSIGTITINGNYTQSALGSYIVQVDPAGNSDLLNILGTATLDGTVGISAINNGFLRDYPYTILTAPGGVSGTFSNTNTDGVFNQGLLQGKVLYFPAMVQFIVNYNPVLFNEFAETPNQKAVAAYILETGGTPAVQELIASITTEAGFQSALDQISGATYANNDVMITRVGNWFSGEMADRFDAFPSCNCRVSLLPANRRGCDQRNGFWAAGHGAQEDIKSGQVSGLNTATGNFALGYEWAVGSTAKVGVGAGYSTFSSTAQTREMANTTGNLYQLGVYGRHQMGNWLLGAAFDAGLTSDLSTDRQIDGALAVVTTKGSSEAHLYSEQVRLGYDLTSNRPMRLSPFVGVIGQQLHRNSFAETTQTGFELNVDGSTYRSTRSQLGVMLELPTNSPFKPFASLDWEHEFSDVNSTFNANLVGLEGKFHIQGQAIGRNSALLKAGTVIACGKNWNVSALYQGWYGSGWQENGGTLQASVAFG